MKIKAALLALIVLAAGQGTRMNSDLPKVLHRVGAAPLVAIGQRMVAGETVLADLNSSEPQRPGFEH